MKSDKFHLTYEEVITNAVKAFNEGRLQVQGRPTSTALYWAPEDRCCAIGASLPHSVALQCEHQLVSDAAFKKVVAIKASSAQRGELRSLQEAHDEAHEKSGADRPPALEAFARTLAKLAAPLGLTLQPRAS